MYKDETNNVVRRIPLGRRRRRSHRDRMPCDGPFDPTRPGEILGCHRAARLIHTAYIMQDSMFCAKRFLSYFVTLFAIGKMTQRQAYSLSFVVVWQLSIQALRSARGNFHGVQKKLHGVNRSTSRREVGDYTA